MRVLLGALLVMQTGSAFVLRPSCLGRAASATILASTPMSRRGGLVLGRSMTTMVAASGVDKASAAGEQLSAERYVICNRFNNRMSKAALFEKRWAERKSSLAKLDGFRFFTLLRRKDVVGDKEMNYPENTPDYMSMTVWENKDNFVAWRKGPAFKEAHGGGTVGGILSAIYGVITELKNMPKTGAWEGLIPITSDAKIELKGRREDNGMAAADGKSLLPIECFVAMNRMTVAEGKGPELEEFWRSRESTLSAAPGFIGFTFMRKDGEGKKGKPLPDDVFNYSTCTVWKDYESFVAWQKVHSAKAEGQEAKGEGRGGFGHLLEGSPSAIYWEGTQVIQSPVGF